MNTGAPLIKTEYFHRTSRGATAMKFLDSNAAIAWYENQKKKHGNALPEMVFVKQVTIIQESEYDHKLLVDSSITA